MFKIDAEVKSPRETDGAAADDRETSALSRRDLLKRAGQAGAVAAGAALGALPARAQVTASNDDTFDYVVVGSGAGGGPVACNLAKAGFRVLLLEAGEAPDNRNYQVPSFHGLSTEDPSMSWNYYVQHYANAGQQAKDSKVVPGRGVLLSARRHAERPHRS